MSSVAATRSDAPREGESGARGRPGWGAPGLVAVYRKELADHVSGWRFLVLSGLVIVTGIAAAYVAAQTLSDTLAAAGELDPFVFLRLYTTGSGSLPPFTFFVAILAPLLGIALGFDGINGERSRGTLSRLVSQPIHRDAIINGKFLAGLAVISLMLAALVVLVGALGLQLLGLAPTLEEFLRLAAFCGVSIVYVAFWLSLALLCSTLLRQTVASALTALALWLFFSLFAGLLFGLIADAVAPVTDPLDPAQVLRHTAWEANLGRLSPTILYQEAVQTLLNPQVRSLGPLLLEQVVGAVAGAPLPLGQSLLLIWPHLTALLALTIVCFAAAYIAFMRQEIRAW
ncbi:MAG: ABC transporter permease [Limnochordales bacterium]|nr:ABC transporter permease [Limnochordales bacterium]